MRRCDGPTPPYVCGPVTTDPQDEYQCEPFSVCLPNGALHYDGSCVSFVKRSDPIPDGTYTTISFKNGCIASAGMAALPTYTPSDCCGAPGGGGEGGTSDVVVSPRSTNLLSLAPDGLLAEVFVVAGSGINVTGAGPATNPITISALPQTQQPITARGNPPILVSGEGTLTSSLVVRMQSGTLSPGIYGGLEIDEFGLVQGFTPSEGAGVSITGVLPIRVDTLSPNAFTIAVDTSTATVSETVVVGRHEITINSFGMITDIREVRSAIEPGQFFAPQGTASSGAVIPARVVSYNADGYITGVEPA